MSDRLTEVLSTESGQTRGKGEPASLNRKGCDIGYAPAISSCEGANRVDARTVAALMRSLLSQIQTPTAPRRTSRFFRVWLLVRSPCRAYHSAYFGVARFISPILSAVDASQIKQSLH